MEKRHSVWYNIKHECVGALFQSRFKSIPVDNEGAWAFYCAMYIHLNPIRIKALGLGKEDRQRAIHGQASQECTERQRCEFKRENVRRLLPFDDVVKAVEQVGLRMQTVSKAVSKNTEMGKKRES